MIQNVILIETIIILFNTNNKIVNSHNTYNQIVQFDGRKKHYVTKVTEGIRFSVVFYKMFDRRYDSQPHFTGTKTQKLT